MKTDPLERGRPASAIACSKLCVWRWFNCNCGREICCPRRRSPSSSAFSRQPVREAFIKLAEIGLVEVRPQRGTFVMLISRRQVENARFIREAIEVAVVRKACEEASDESIAVMRDIVARQKLVSVTGDLAGFLRLDEALHQSIARSVDCEQAWRLLENLKAQMDRVRYLSLPHETPVDTLIGQHEAIVEAVAAHDADRAEKRMREHLSEILKSPAQDRGRADRHVQRLAHCAKGGSRFSRKHCDHKGVDHALWLRPGAEHAARGFLQIEDVSARRQE